MLDLVYRLLDADLGEANLRYLDGAKVGKTYRHTKYDKEDFITIEVSFRVKKNAA